MIKSIKSRKSRRRTDAENIELSDVRDSEAHLRDSSILDTPSNLISLDSDVLIEHIERDLDTEKNTNEDVQVESSKNDKVHETTTTSTSRVNRLRYAIDTDQASDTESDESEVSDGSDNNEDHIDHTDHSDLTNLTDLSNLDLSSVSGPLPKIFINSYDILLFKGYQIFNLLMSLMLLGLFVFVRKSFMLALFLMGIMGIQLPIAYHHVVEAKQTRRIYDTYFIQTGIYYAILSVYSVIVNAYYGDTMGELMSLFFYSNVPTILSLACFMLSLESIRYDKVRNIKHESSEVSEPSDLTESSGLSESSSTIHSEDRIVCESEDSE